MTKATIPNNRNIIIQGILFAVCVALTSTETLARSNVPADQALNDATKIAQRYDWDIYKGSGKSMDPSFSSTSFLLVKKLSFESINIGMTILFHDFNGDTVAHRVIGHTESGMIITRGINNTKTDPHPITRDQVIGALVGTIDSNQALNGFISIPTAIGKTYP